MRTRTRAKRTSTPSTSPPNPARANSVQGEMKLTFLVALVAFTALAAGCASYDGHTLVPGESTVDDVEAVMGRPADKRAGPDGQTIYWYPQVPYGRANFAARIAPDGTL